MTLEQTQPPLPTPSWREWLLLLLRRRALIRVTGDSMRPTLSSGDMVLVNPSAYNDKTPRVGDIVLARHPYQRDLTIIKRVAEVTAEGRIVLHSDNPNGGTDSRSFGTLALERIIGKVTSRVKADS